MAETQERKGKTMSAQDNAALARAMYDAFNKKDFDRVLTWATEDVEIAFIPFGQTFRGRDGFRDFLQGFVTAFPDVTIEVTNQIATEDAIVNELIGRGTHTGPLLTPAGEIAPTGRPIEVPVCEVWAIKNGKLASVHNYQDSATMLRQLGLMR
jgi:steroid delta-isomerase-like uncharacterized protein